MYHVSLSTKPLYCSCTCVIEWYVKKYKVLYQLGVHGYHGETGMVIGENNGGREKDVPCWRFRVVQELELKGRDELERYSIVRVVIGTGARTERRTDR